jgi:hypothetical protein
MFQRFKQADPLAFLSATIILYILRMVGPYVNYIFIPFLFLFFLFTAYHIIVKKYSVILREIFRFNFYLILISLFFIWGFLNTSTFVFPVFKELLNIFIILFLVVCVFLFIRTVESFNKFYEIFCKQLMIFSSIIAVFGLVKFYFQLKGTELHFLHLPKHIDGTSLTTDYNFYILFSIISIISILIGIEAFKTKNKYFKSKLLSALLFVLSLNIFFSYSRRGFILLFLVILYCIYIILREYKRNRKIFLILSAYIGAFLLFILLFLAFLFKAPTQFKRDTLNVFGISVRSYRYFSSTLLFRYSTIFSKVEYSDFYDSVWRDTPNSIDPSSGWDTKVSTVEFPLRGKNVAIVPEKSIGYRMDSTCDAITWNNNAYSYTDISILFKGDTISKLNEFYIASVYCFVSDDFDGTWARISAEGGASGKISQEYDLIKKGTWQKLTINFNQKGVIPPVYLYWAKNGQKDFHNLKGYVIFAYPEYSIRTTDPKDPDSGWGVEWNSTREFQISGEDSEIVPKNAIGYKMDSTCYAATWNNNAYSYTDISSLFKSDTLSETNKYFYSSVYCFISKDFDGTWAHLSAEGESSGKTVSEYDLSRKGSWQKLEIEFVSKSNVPPVYLYWSKYGVNDFKKLKGFIIFAYPEYYKKT